MGVSRRNIAEMMSAKNTRYGGAALGFFLLALWSGTRPDPEIHIYAANLFWALGVGTLVYWLVRYRDSER